MIVRDGLGDQRLCGNANVQIVVSGWDSTLKDEKDVVQNVSQLYGKQRNVRNAARAIDSSLHLLMSGGFVQGNAISSGLATTLESGVVCVAVNHSKCGQAGTAVFIAAGSVLNAIWRGRMQERHGADVGRLLASVTRFALTVRFVP